MPQTDVPFIYYPDGSVAINPAYQQSGGYVHPDFGVLNQHVREANAALLKPTQFQTVVGPGSLANTALVSSPLGCDKPTGQEMGIQAPVWPAFTDIYGLNIAGGLYEGQPIQSLQTSPGHPMITGQPGAPLGRLPFLYRAYLKAPLKQLKYGEYPWDDADGEFGPAGHHYDALGKVDPTVNKPEYYLDFDPAHLYVNADDQLSIITDGNAGAYAAGQGIKFVPGDSPATAPGIVVNAGGSVDAGAHFYWYSWTYPAAVGTVDSALSPSAYAKTDSSHKSVDVTTPAKPVGSAATGLKIWRSTVADPNTPKLLTTIGTTGAQTYTDTTADSGLGAAHVVSQTQIAARPDLVTIGFNANGELQAIGGACPLVLPCYPPDITTVPKYNAGTLSLGPWPSDTVTNGTLYDATVDSWPDGTLNPWILLGIDKTDALSIRDFLKVADKGSSYRTSFGVFAAPAGTLGANQMLNQQTEMHLYTHGNIRLDGSLNAGYGLANLHNFNGAVAFNMSSLSTGGFGIFGAPALYMEGDAPQIKALHSTAITLAGGAGGVQITGSGGLSLGSTTVFTPTNGMTMPDAKNIALGTTTGTKIGTSTSQKLGFFNAVPVIQPGTTAGTGTTAGATYGSNEQAMLQDCFAALEALGLLA